MLLDWNKGQMPEKVELEARLQAARAKLAACQTQLKEKKLPVLVLMEGWGAAGKGSILGKVIRNIDPRFFKVATMDAPTVEEQRKPFLYRYFVRIPEAGKYMFLDGGWMDEITAEKLSGKLKEKDYKKRIESVRRFERQLTDNGYLVMKFFFQISEKEQKKRLDALLQSKNTRWRVSEKDRRQNQHYDETLEVFDQYLCDTNQSTAPWYIIDAKKKKWAELQVLEFLVEGIHTALKNTNIAVPILQNSFPLVPAPKLAEVDLNHALSEEEYRAELEKYQKRLSELHNIIYRKKRGIISMCEKYMTASWHIFRLILP